MGLSAQRRAEYEAAFGPRRLKPVSMQSHETVFSYGARCMIDGDSQDHFDTMERIEMGPDTECERYRTMFGETHATDFREPTTAETIAYSYLLADAMQQTGDL